MERFVEGEPMLNFVGREDEHHSRKDREELATIGLKTVMEMIFLHDFVHADLVRAWPCLLCGTSSWPGLLLASRTLQRLLTNQNLDSVWRATRRHQL